MQTLPPALRNNLDEANLGLVQEFRQYLVNGPRTHSPDTVSTYVGHLGTFLRHLPATENKVWVECITRANLNRVLTSIPAHQAATRRNLLFATRAMADFLVAIELIPPQQAEAVRAVKLVSKHRPARPCLSNEQFHACIQGILAHRDYTDLQRLTNLTIFALLGRTGIRSSELAELRKQDVNMEKGIINVLGKGGKLRMVGLSTTVAPILRLYLKNRPQTTSHRLIVGEMGNPLNRNALTQRFKTISALTGIKASPHRLRRTFATTIAHKGIPLDKLQSVLGHSNILTTRDYVQTRGEDVAAEMVNWW